MKVYLVTREDLPIGAQSVQSTHAMTAFMMEHPGVAQDWYHKSNTLVLLAVRNEAELYDLLDVCRRKSVTHSLFREPDFGNALTALAIGPDGKRLVRSLKKALRPSDNVRKPPAPQPCEEPPVPEQD